MNIRMLLVLCMSIGTLVRADVPYSNARQALSTGIKRFDLKLTLVALETLEKSGQRVPLVEVLNELDAAINGHQWWTKWGWRAAAATCMSTAAVGIGLSGLRNFGVWAVRNVNRFQQLFNEPQQFVAQGVRATVGVGGAGAAARQPVQGNETVNFIARLPIFKVSVGVGLASVGSVLLCRSLAYWRIKSCARKFLVVLEKHHAIVRNEQPLADYALARMHKLID